MPANTLLSGLTGQRYSGCFLYMAHRFPSANIFHSGISRPAISRRPHLSLQSKFQPFVCDNFSSRRLRRRSQSYGFQPFAFFFYFFLFFCSLFFLFFFASFCFFAFFHILYHPIYRIFIFPYFFCGFLHEKTGRITAAGKSGVIWQISLQVLLRILLSCRLQWQSHTLRNTRLRTCLLSTCNY